MASDSITERAKPGFRRSPRPAWRSSRKSAFRPMEPRAKRPRSYRLPLRSALAHEPPELPLVEERDPVPLVAEPLDLHELQPRVAPRGLPRVGAAADEHGGADGGHPVHDGS